MENCPTVNAPVLQRVRKVGTPGDIHRLAICIVWQKMTSSDPSATKVRKAGNRDLIPAVARIAPLAIFRLSSQGVRTTQSGPADALNDLLLLFEQRALARPST